jgi:hypothetical protein
MGGPPARSGELHAELGHSRRPRSHDRLVRFDLCRRAAAHARPRLHGLAPGPVTGGGRRDQLRGVHAPPRAAPATDAARRPSQRRTEPMRPGAGTNDGWGSRFPRRDRQHRAVTLRGSSCPTMSDRSVGTERFLGRRASARQSHRRKSMGPDPVKLFGAARKRARHRCANHPDAASQRWPTPKRLTKAQRHTPLDGVGPGIVISGQVVEDIKRFETMSGPGLIRFR